MLVACWSAKGGSGTTVVAAALAAVLARSAPSAGAVLVDLAGDLPAVLGVPEPPGPGVAQWLAAGASVPADGLARLEAPLGDGLSLVPAGGVPLPAAPGRGEVLAALLAADARPVVVDCGSPALAGGAPLAVAAAATHSLLVLRPCYLALRRAAASPLRPSGVVLVAEPWRSLRASDVEDVLGVPVRAVVQHDPGVARAVDAGLLSARLPGSLRRSLRAVA